MPHVVVIEDNLELGEILREALDQAGYDVSVAPDGRAGLALLRARPVDLVVTDIFMPEMDGIETILEVQRHFPAVPIVAMSGGGMLGNMTYLPAASQLGVARTLRKPFDCAELVAVARELLGR